MKKLLIGGGMMLGVLAITISSCVKPKTYPVIPAIKYKDFVMYGSDSAHFIFTFTDGDGDVGLKQSDTLPPFNANSKYYYNLYLKYYYQDSTGAFHTYITMGGDTLVYAYRIPYITPDGKNKVLNGEIKVNMVGPYYAPQHKVIKYEAYMYDRALHKSNVISTPPIQVP